MLKNLKIIKAEIIKQHKNYFHNKVIYISLFLWPVLDFITTWYNFQNFNLDKSNLEWLDATNFTVYLILGYIFLHIFRSLVQSAWNFSLERYGGTLELMYLTPANNQAILLGNTLSSFIEGSICMLVFGLGIFIFNSDTLNINLISCMVIFLITCILATLWGMFLNAIFLYSRDSSWMFTVLDEPMGVFGGTIVPINLMPFWAKILGSLFPITYMLEAMKKAVFQNLALFELKRYLMIGIIWIIVLYLLVSCTLILAQRHSKETGNFTLF